MFYFLINKEILLLKSSKIQSQISMTKYIQVNDRLLPLTFSLLSTHADRQGVGISFTVCLCVFCTDTDFSVKDKASSNLLGGSSASKAGSHKFL